MSTRVNTPDRPYRRVIGPVPPRDAKGRMLLKPIMGERVKTNVLGEPIRDPKDGSPVMEKCDLRDPRDYLGLIVGEELADGATKGLSLFECDLSPIPGGEGGVPEPLMQVWAKDEADAQRVYFKEWGITKVNSMVHELKITKLESK